MFRYVMVLLFLTLVSLVGVTYYYGNPADREQRAENKRLQKLTQRPSRVRNDLDMAVSEGRTEDARRLQVELRQAQAESHAEVKRLQKRYGW